MEEEYIQRGRSVSTHQSYGEVLSHYKDVFIPRFFMVNFDDVTNDLSNEYRLHEISKLPLEIYEDADTVDFKTEWEFYISSGLST